MADALQNVLTEAGLAIAPLRAINTPDKAVALFRQLGYEIPGGAFGGSLSGLATHAGELIAAVRQLAGASGDAAVISAVINIFARLVATIDAVKHYTAHSDPAAADAMLDLHCEDVFLGCRSRLPL